jgi:hypothetical protein
MSNPGVIVLVEKKLNSTENFRIEDNLGEAIHIHYANIRIDLSIKDLLYIADVAADSVNILLKESSFNINDYDINFLNEYAGILSDLVSVEHISIPVSTVRFRARNWLGLPITQNIQKAVKKYKKQDTIGAVIVFSDSPVVMYGETIALETFIHNQHTDLPVTRFVFTGDRHSVRKHPWIGYLFKWDKRRFYNLLKKLVKKFL